MKKMFVTLMALGTMASLHAQTGRTTVPNQPGQNNADSANTRPRVKGAGTGAEGQMAPMPTPRTPAASGGTTVTPSPTGPGSPRTTPTGGTTAGGGMGGGTAPTGAPAGGMGGSTAPAGGM